MKAALWDSSEQSPWAPGGKHFILNITFFNLHDSVNAVNKCIVLSFKRSPREYQWTRIMRAYEVNERYKAPYLTFIRLVMRLNEVKRVTAIRILKRSGRMNEENTTGEMRDILTARILIFILLFTGVHSI